MPPAPHSLGATNYQEDTLVITVIQRKDYTVGNRQKTVKRQIKNHNDLIALIEQQLPHAEVPLRPPKRAEQGREWTPLLIVGGDHR